MFKGWNESAAFFSHFNVRFFFFFRDAEAFRFRRANTPRCFCPFPSLPLQQLTIYKKKKKSFRTCCRELATLAHTHTHTNTEEHRRAEQFTLPCVFIFPRFAFFTPIR